MRKTSVLLIVVMISSCSMFTEPWTGFDYWFHHEEQFANLREILDFGVSHLTYGQGGYMTPKEVYESKSQGPNCQGFTILDGYFAEELGYDVKVIELHHTESGANHVILSVDGVWVEPQLNGSQLDNPLTFDDYTYMRTYEYDEFVWIFVRMAS